VGGVGLVAAKLSNAAAAAAVDFAADLHHECPRAYCGGALEQ